MPTAVLTSRRLRNPTAAATFVHMFARFPRYASTALAAAVIAVSAASVSQAMTPVKRSPAAAAAWHGCGGFRYQHGWYHTVRRGHVRCRTARHVMRAFLSGHGRMHGPKDGPAAKQYWTLRGWKCGHGAGGGGCVRRHSRQAIEAVWVRNTR